MSSLPENSSLENSPENAHPTADLGADLSQDISSGYDLGYGEASAYSLDASELDAGGSEVGGLDAPADFSQDELNQVLETKLERLEQLDREIAHLSHLSAELTSDAIGDATLVPGTVTTGTVIHTHPPVPTPSDVRFVSQQVSDLQPHLRRLQDVIIDHQIELRSELHAMRAEFGKLQQQKEQERSKLDDLRDKFNEQTERLKALSQAQKIAIVAGGAFLIFFVLYLLNQSVSGWLRKLRDPIKPGSPQAFVRDHMQEIRDGKLDDTWGQVSESFKQEAAQGDFEAYKDWWTKQAYPVGDVVSSVVQVKLYTEWQYCDRKTGNIIENVGFWYLSKAYGEEWRLDRIEVPPNRPGRKVGEC